jgi:serine/threonine protein phosphatase PrpC
MGIVNHWGHSDTGLQRSNNEDSWFASSPLRIAVLADGMGGEACGEVASSLAQPSPNTVHLTILIRLETSIRRVGWRLRGRRL